jgi:Holliday junction resolvase
MTQRSMTSQSKHDSAVRRIARDLKAKGYDVRADVTGFSQPRTFGGYKPDVVATKGKYRKIIEVETTESVASARDVAQQSAFRRVANRSQNTVFRRDIVKTRQ